MSGQKATPFKKKRPMTRLEQESLNWKYSVAAYSADIHRLHDEVTAKRIEKDKAS
jgi:hypothetical protein